MEQESSENGAADMLTIEDVCAKLQVSRWTINELVRSRQLPSVKIGRRRFIPRRSLQAYEKRLEEDGDER